MRFAHHRALARAAVITGVIGAIAASCSGSKHTAAPTPSADLASSSTPFVARPTPSPTSAPADAQLAARLRAEGDFEGAINVYGAVAAKTQGATRQDAREAQAQLLSKTGRGAEAKPVLESYVADAGADADSSAARYMLASTLDDLGDMAGAIDQYGRYIAAGGVLADFARVERAKLLARSGRIAEGEAAGQEVQLSALLPAFKASFTFSMARAFEQGGADQNALAWYERAKQGGDVASALARSGAIKKRLGDPAWTADYAQAVRGYPESGVANELLDELDAAAVPVSSYTRGLVRYRASQDGLARPALLQAIAEADHPAEATYYLAAIDERAGDTVAAIAGYQRAHDIDATSPLADDALWWRGKLLEQAGRYDEAAATFTGLIVAYPTSTWAGDAGFHRGMVLYRSGNYVGAASAWESDATVASGSDALRARFWQGRALRTANDPQADAVLTQLHTDAPDDFYGLRAEVLLGKNDSKDRKAKLDQQKTDWDKIASYLKDEKGVDPRAYTGTCCAQWSQALELRKVGLTTQSDTVARAALASDALDSTSLYADIKAAQDAGDASLAARAATALLEDLKDAPKPPPADLFRISYPLAYSGLVSDAAKNESVPPLLLLALVRQESYFEPDAGSTAGALGLTQVVPSTGESIAAELGVTDFKPEDLYRPKVSLQFGANFLGGVLSQFDDDPYHALAAYNGGPGTASNAIKTAGDDEDLFIEDLEFDETRLYVRLVMEYYARYRQLYQGIDRPSLPR